ncbi:MAG TPA: DUF4168 domain-containing protein [Burkholderiales bacterium]|nr:DUF4168 domain-containing protein [Burkholderiales bacterium]
MMHSRFWAIATVILLSIVSTPSAWPQLAQAAVEQTALPYSDAELRSVARAVLEVQRINNAYVPKLEAARTPEEEQGVVQAASREMNRAVEQSGMSVDRYREILIHAEQDSTLADRIRDHIRNTQ